MRMTAKTSSPSRTASLSREHKRSCAFAHDETVGACVKGRGVAWRKGPDGAELGVVAGSIVRSEAPNHRVDLAREASGKRPGQPPARRHTLVMAWLGLAEQVGDAS